jgi:hypothetical protein
MPKADSGAFALASLLDDSTAGELIPELARHGLQQLIELEVAAVLGADRHERTEERLGLRNGYRARTLTTWVGDGDHGGIHRLALQHSTVLRRALTSLRPAYRRTSSGFGPAAAPGLLFGGKGTSSRGRQRAIEP